MPEWSVRERSTALEAGDPSAGLLPHDRLIQLRGEVWPVPDERSEQRRRERIATRVIEVRRRLDRRRERGHFALVLSLAAMVAGLGAAVPLLQRFPGEPQRAESPAAEGVRLLAGHASVRSAGGNGPLDPLHPGQLQLASDAVLVTPSVTPRPSSPTTRASSASDSYATWAATPTPSQPPKTTSSATQKASPATRRASSSRPSRP